MRRDCSTAAGCICTMHPACAAARQQEKQACSDCLPSPAAGVAATKLSASKGGVVKVGFMHCATGTPSSRSTLGD